ncbi:MarR family winged helix-turn-helix transcriptional regulator [Mobilicoccus pelagius]|uniref:Putative MarR family transcriptional regulator n=1 Tax=Mobilicoccus pelagius NBRC 104925 TaxID=1089455 RepID=H5UPM5_9MICO|nr:MarR family winged helix-turn-helix transcriptional regulator [Mobilicoccus pelagius]GAB47683.1 putative MarR family transcriptional regulator [Mobilicoccus pelagius NBRC 104925]
MTPTSPTAADGLLTSARRLHRDLTITLEAEIGLQVDQWRALRRLDRDSGVTMSELGTQLGIPAATTTRLVDFLVDRGLSHRRATGDDRRRVTVLLTDEGADMLERADGIVAGRLAAPAPTG